MVRQSLWRYNDPAVATALAAAAAGGEGGDNMARRSSFCNQAFLIELRCILLLSSLSSSSQMPIVL